MSGPGPEDPLYWPEAPALSVFHPGGDFTGWSRGWVVDAVPPDPWPFIVGPAPRPLYGPPGTLWLFYADDAADQVSRNGAGLTERVVNWFLARWKLPGLDGHFPVFWRTPEPNNQEAIMPQDSVRVTIHGKLGTDEEVAHVLHLVSPDVPVTNLSILGPACATAWQNFLNEPLTTTGTVKSHLSSVLTYDEVRIAAIRYAPPAKPLTTVNTEYYPITGGHCTDQPLPNEVAMCLSFQTAKRGPRNRGRLYLGPPGISTLDGVSGKFSTVIARDIATNFHAKFMADPAINNIANFAVVSSKFGTHEWITGVRVGAVPDSMRTRRQSQAEAYVTVWTQP